MATMSDSWGVLTTKNMAEMRVSEKLLYARKTVSSVQLWGVQYVSGPEN